MNQEIFNTEYLKILSYKNIDIFTIIYITKEIKIYGTAFIVKN